MCPILKDSSSPIFLQRGRAFSHFSRMVYFISKSKAGGQSWAGYTSPHTLKTQDKRGLCMMGACLKPLCVPSSSELLLQSGGEALSKCAKMRWLWLNWFPPLSLAARSCLISISGSSLHMSSHQSSAAPG